MQFSLILLLTMLSKKCDQTNFQIYKDNRLAQIYIKIALKFLRIC